ncbi:MAG TPA: indolepyruvate oxidoreductase subunit beta family protein [Burkholderiaceae bacterium]|nr:indolepyruvate oxidoreductase subunit beta family protein [Burkholderiaceae bacterium]
MIVGAPDDPARSVYPVTLLVCALGGEGGGVLAEWLVEAATLAGYPAQSTSIPGVAQRTGATTYYIEVFPRPAPAPGERAPVFGLSPVAGALDALVSSELLETTRQVGSGMVSRDRTLVISARDRTLTTAEKMAPADGRVPDRQLIDVVRQHSRAVHLLDMRALAARTGTVVSAVMLGAIAGSGLLPVRRDAFEAAISLSGKGVPASLRGFAAAFEAIAASAGQVQAARATVAALAYEPAPRREQDEWPASIQPFAALGVERTLQYQGREYADLYRRRLARIVAAERAADPDGVHDRAAARATARFLALWMTFDDIVHVARLKSRAARWIRVRNEVKAAPGEIVRVYDHFKPGIPEFAALLPPPVARGLIAWDRRRQARGKEPFAFPLEVGAHGVRGLSMLRLLAWLRWLRPYGVRYREEQALIEAWLARIEQGLCADWALGHEIALCGRLIKGYGATLERGKQNLAHVLEHLADGSGPAAERARAIALARNAALADDAGKALDLQLVDLGVPARPTKPQPIVWARSRARDERRERKDPGRLRG